MIIDMIGLVSQIKNTYPHARGEGFQALCYQQLAERVLVSRPEQWWHVLTRLVTSGAWARFMSTYEYQALCQVERYGISTVTLTLSARQLNNHPEVIAYYYGLYELNKVFGKM